MEPEFGKQEIARREWEGGDTVVFHTGVSGEWIMVEDSDSVTHTADER